LRRWFSFDAVHFSHHRPASCRDVQYHGGRRNYTASARLGKSCPDAQSGSSTDANFNRHDHQQYRTNARMGFL
jgi:hypothetical protein